MSILLLTRLIVIYLEIGTNLTMDFQIKIQPNLYLNNSNLELYFYFYFFDFKRIISNYLN